MPHSCLPAELQDKERGIARQGKVIDALLGIVRRDMGRDRIAVRLSSIRKKQGEEGIPMPYV